MPDWAAEVRPRLSSLRLSPAREAEIVEELSQHLDDRWRELVAAGRSPDEARRMALAEFRDRDTLARYLAPLRQAHPPEPLVPGGPTRHLFSDVRQDVRYAWRTLRKHPGFTFSAVLTLALGIGANASIFAVINAVLIRPLPYPDSEQLVALYTRYLPATGFDFPYFSLSGPEFVDVRGRGAGFAHVAAYGFEGRNLTGAGEDAYRVRTMPVTADFFNVLQVQPASGRTFSEDEAQGREGCVVVLAHALSEQIQAPAGSTIRLDDTPCAVIGVMPDGFAFSEEGVQVWTVLRINAEETPLNRASHPLLVIARLRDGVTREQADAQLQSLREYWSEKYPDHYAKGHFAIARPLHEDLVGEQRNSLLLLGGGVLFVLLIVCVNLAALLVSTGEARRREFALRHALGAHRLRLVRQLVVEALLLAAIGGVLGVVLAQSSLGTLLALYPQQLPASQPIAIDYGTLLYAFAVVVAAGLMVGLAPALLATGKRMQDALKAESHASTTPRRTIAIRSVLVIGQLASTVVLLVGAVLLLRSYQQLQHVDLGIDPERVLTFSISVPAGRQPDPAAARRTLAAIEERLSSTADVDSAGMISNLPLASAGPPDSFIIDGRPDPPAGAPAWNARYLLATPGLFRALRVPLKRGRLLDAGDAAGQPLVAVINETATRLYWPTEDPVGKTIRYYPRESSPPIRIVGIAGDVRSMGASLPAPPVIYVPLAQAPRPPYQGRTMTFVVRARGEPAGVVGTARAAVASIDTGLPLANVRPMSDVVSATVGQPRFTSLVMSFFAATAFFLAALGLYGVLAHTVEQRTREIGVRVALGADRHGIYRLILRDGLVLTLVGVGIGVPAALVATRLMTGLLSGITSTDPVTYLLVVAMVSGSALLASYLPARRATRVDPLIALRAE